MSRTLRLTLAALLAVCLIVWLRSFGDAVDSPPLISASEPAQPAKGPAQEALRTPAAEETHESVRVEVSKERERVEVQVQSLCVVHGRVLDESGEALQDVEVRLDAYEVWAQGFDVPRLEGRFDMRGFIAQTGASGDFRFEVPPPTAEIAWLKITPDRFHDAHRLRFGVGRSGLEPPLVAGVRELGEIRLATTGSLRGRVVAEDGRPLVGVNMDIGPGRSTTYSRGGQTGEDGRYVIGHAPIGSYAIKAKFEGYLSGYINPVTVVARRDTEVVDFVLKSAPTLEGVVLDEAGRPLKGAKLWGWPASSGSGAGTTTGADGRFVISLPQDEPYSLSAKLDGYRRWGEEHDKSITYEAGGDDLEIILESLPLTKFVVVDAKTGAAIESFGLSILEDNGSLGPGVYTERRRPRIKAHAGGSAEETAREGLDLFLVSANGYLLATGDVKHDVEGVPEQTVRMRRGVTLRGRIVLEGRAVAGVRIEVVNGGMVSFNFGGGAESTTEFHVDKSSLLSAMTDKSGHFELTGLTPGTHRLIARPQVGTALVLQPLEIPGPGVQDLGDLELPLHGATIVGEVLLPAGVEPAGLKVYLNDWRDDVTTIVDGASRFRFENLAPGSHTVTLDGRPGELADSRLVEVEVAVAETAAVMIDAREQAMCRVTLTIDLGEFLSKGYQVDLVSMGARREQETLGQCDENGVVRGFARAWGKAQVRVWLPGSGQLLHPTVRLDLQPRGEVNELVKYELASVKIELGGGVSLPKNGTARLRLTSLEPDAVMRKVEIDFREGEPREKPRAFAHVEAGAIHFAGLLAGEFEATFELLDDETEPVEARIGDKVFLHVSPPYFSATREIELTVGNELLLRFD